MSQHIQLTADTWTNLTAAASLSAGDDALVQNLQFYDIFVEPSVAAPSGKDYGELVESKKYTTVATGVSDNIWAYCGHNTSVFVRQTA